MTVIGQLIQDCISEEFEAKNTVNASQPVSWKVGLVIRNIMPFFGRMVGLVGLMLYGIVKGKNCTGQNKEAEY